MPFDNVKTRMQRIGAQERGMLEVVANMLAKEGVSVFWKATTPRLVRLTVGAYPGDYPYHSHTFALLTVLH
jgi:solute carrier family 25 (mitochondrial citrate transporter), member 1